MLLEGSSLLQPTTVAQTESFALVMDDSAYGCDICGQTSPIVHQITMVAMPTAFEFDFLALIGALYCSFLWLFLTNKDE